MRKPIVIKAGSESPDETNGTSFAIPRCLATLRTRCEVVVTEDEAQQTLIDAVAGASILMYTYGNITREVLEAGQPNLKTVIKMGTGIDSVDFTAAKALGVRVVNCPDYARFAVAETAFLLLINCFKKFIPMHRAMCEAGWAAPGKANQGFELRGKTVGLVGVGHINAELAQMCSGFGMQVQGYSPRMDRARMQDHGVEKVDSLPELAAQADALCICVPLTAETTGLISREVLEAMKPSAFLINVGRGATVDEEALVECVEQGVIAGCGLDVYSQEPLNKDDHPMAKLLNSDNAVLTPHLAAWTKDTWQRLEQDIVTHVFNVLDNQPLVINSTDRRLAGQPDCVYPHSKAN
ncbi:NAD(P)-dependent oxidoreductase [Aliamphritea hakodatensis]|uniref:NAD(P)-dependent oxidoreductase n=1 Tax=Aliamphritea hakodatensis TaxID=2895352 RepID=UPI0022FD8864|nr:NAD(P)-dependent oxidoreductase [Aliamphritea hakodatensis]